MTLTKSIQSFFAVVLVMVLVGFLFAYFLDEVPHHKLQVEAAQYYRFTVIETGFIANSGDSNTYEILQDNKTKAQYICFDQRTCLLLWPEVR
jgi:hypothetical protein